jgi:hypothetical protein
LARPLALLGSWCEGETRTGRPWPAVDRSFWHQWGARFDRELDRFSRGLCPAWGLPETASAEERALWDADLPLAQRLGTVLISARNQETADAVGDACRQAGFVPHCVGPGRQHQGRGGGAPPSGAVAAVWEGTQCEPHEVRQLARFCRALAGVPVVVLLDFPRPEGRDRARAAGAAEVVGKPFRLVDLLAHLDRAIGLPDRATVCTAHCLTRGTVA